MKIQLMAIAAAASIGSAHAQQPNVYSYPSTGSSTYAPPPADLPYQPPPQFPPQYTQQYEPQYQPQYQQPPQYQQQPQYPQQAYPQQQQQFQQQPYQQPYQHQPYQQTAAPRPLCFECGTVESMREVEKKGDGTGLGAVAGGLGGLILGKQLGNGKGQNVGALLGAAGGAYAGHQIEKNVHSTKSYEIHVRMEDGSFRTVQSATASGWRTGDRVRIINGQVQSDMR